MRLPELTDGVWISGSESTDGSTTPPYLLKKAFSVQKEVKRAWICASALGCFLLTLNHQRVSKEFFAPGYSQYNKRILYKRYEATELLRQGENVISAELANGWYAGRLGLVLQNNCFGNKRAFRLMLFVSYTDGTQEVVETDDTWLVSQDGPRRQAEFFDGEVFDARIDPDKISYHPALCFHSLEEAMGAGKKKRPAVPKLEPFDGSPVLLHDRADPQRISVICEDTIQLDFGTNSSKIIALENVVLAEGVELIIRHGEVLDQNGRIYTNNLRSAKAEIRYTAKAGVQSYIPQFTYMGFRYAEVQVKHSESAQITQDLHRSISQDHTLAAYEIYSDMKKTGAFSCSDPRINQLQRNIETSMRSNFVDIPTDCPQRDERSGWTGDIALFIPTACFNYDIKQFMRKWLRDMALTQKENGVIPHIIPDNGLLSGIGKGLAPAIMRHGAAVWGDAAVLVPWQMYMETGDIGFLENQYASMKAWVSYEEKAAARFSPGENKYIWDKSFQYGDWLAPGESLVQNILKGKWTATAYMANSVSIMKKTAEALGKAEDARYYQALFQRIKSAFRKRFLDRKGHIRKGFQSIWVLAVWFGLLEGTEAENAIADLVEDIKKRDYHLATGFVGTPYICFALSDYGYSDVAYKLLLQETSPGWLYQIKCGATSVWERWDALREDGTVKDGDDAEMNMVSFNHYAYGSIGDWLYKRMGGLEALEPGYKRFAVYPRIGGGITNTSISHICPYGEIVSQWQRTGNRFELNLKVPSGTSAEVTLPNGKTETVSAGSYSFDCKISTD